MKLKHWQGYGTVEAKCITKTDDALVIRVSGLHEYGLARDDEYDVFNWLVKRFDRKRKDYTEIESMHIEDMGDVCVYTIVFRKNPY